MMTSKMAAKNAEVHQIVSFGLDCYFSYIIWANESIFQKKKQYGPFGERTWKKYTYKANPSKLPYFRKVLTAISYFQA